jgi:hypothetical protein
MKTDNTTTEDLAISLGVYPPKPPAKEQADPSSIPSDERHPCRTWAANGHDETVLARADYADHVAAERDELKTTLMKTEPLREALKFIATDKFANAADMRYRAARALESLQENARTEGPPTTNSNETNQ